MAWTTLLNAIFAVDKPITSSTGLALRDNPGSIAAGDVGAPRIRIGALERLVAGYQIRSRTDPEIVSALGVPLSGYGFSFLQAGSIKVRFSYKNDGSDPGISAYLRRVRNNVSVDLATYGYTTSYQNAEVDVDVLPGDFVYPYLDTTRFVYLKNQRFSTNGQDLFPGSRTPLEANTYA